MITSIQNAGRLPVTNWELFREQGYFLKAAMLGTLASGFLLHLLVIFFGNAFVTENVVSAGLDMVLAIPITYGAAVSWIVWPRVIHRATWHRVVYGILAVYFTVSVPFHLRTYVTGNTDILGRFPEWYSMALLPFLAALMTFVARLEFRGDEERSI